MKCCKFRFPLLSQYDRRIELLFKLVAGISLRLRRRFVVGLLVHHCPFTFALVLF